MYLFSLSTKHIIYLAVIVLTIEHFWRKVDCQISCIYMYLNEYADLKIRSTLTSTNIVHAI